MSDRPTFTQREVDLCLAQAAGLRGSFLNGDLEAPDGDEWAIDEAREWDELARKIASTIPGAELERECSAQFCEGGRTPLDSTCRECLGTGFWPPRRAFDVQLEDDSDRNTANS